MEQQSQEPQQTSSGFNRVATPVVRVRCQNGVPYPVPDPIHVNIHGNQPTVIIWQGDRSVERITAIAIDNPEFDPPVQHGPKTWSCVDHCTTDGNFKYSITAICVGSGGGEVTNDPIINNSDTGSP